MLPQVLTVVSFILALFASWVVLEPFFSSALAETDSGVGSGPELLPELLMDAQYRKEESFLALEELEQDFVAGKISAEDYERSRSELLADTAKLLSEVERLS